MKHLSIVPLLVIIGASAVASIGAEPAAKVKPAKRAGADWWSLQPLIDAPPSVVPGLESNNPIDRFIAAELRRHNLTMSPRADARTLVRRVFFDVIGLPPPPEVVERFAADPSPQAWATLVDDLLASPHYGERWASHWLDVARFGETHGYEYNEPREHAWHYRDWVIRALNADMPYDRFVRMQIAGDLIEPDSRDGAAAVGFLVAGIHNTIIGKGELMQRQARQDELEEIAGVVGQALLGMTVHCARCHDHKFDPIPARDYYRFIASLDGVTHGDRAIGGTPVFTVVPRDPGPMRIHERGDARTLGDAVTPGGIAAITGASASFGLAPDDPDSARRLALAEWIAHRDNPLMHRVIVNRLWHHHFGRGIVDTPGDFGFNGGRPTHPALLDHLALRLRDSGYSLKAMHRLILTSEAYQQSSRPETNPAHERAAEIDPSNRLLWRQNPRRMDAETLRDSILDFAGALNPTALGPGYRDVRIDRVEPTYYYIAIDPVGEEFDRRTIYRWRARGERSALLETFDCPDPAIAAQTRNVTTTPSQALSQWNAAFIDRMSARLAERVRREAGDSVDAQVQRLWLLVLARRPDAAERADAARLVGDHGLEVLARVMLNANETIWIE